jgi:hypothetical protein
VTDLPEEAQCFLRLLDPAAAAFTFQTFQDKPSGAPITKPELARVTQDARDLHHHHQAGAGIYVCVNRTDLRAAKLRMSSASAPFGRRQIPDMPDRSRLSPRSRSRARRVMRIATG